MGHDQHHQSSSSGALVSVIVAVLLIAILGVFAVGGVAFYWMRAARVERQKAMVAEVRAVAEARRAKSIAEKAAQEARTKAMQDPRLDVRIEVDQEGMLSVDGEEIGIDDLERRLAGIKHETSNGFSIEIEADPDCSLKHVIPVLDLCEQIGDIDYRVSSSQSSRPAIDIDDAEKLVR